ncbi:uncharacterized protein LAESUDRAFT_762317 [Laetiporus sulphureus 93-53]|uniref:Hydrophobin n=1 Tax=Laetiporus sulphureus 93-53 TaxID=1314785 RepID=A0A165CIS3_9APHY|nr:uncharacterized protein LAESUDRAFT_762317 [Laetiporus sulphureus 93-53]KZT02885.1 hypothetical protein LAESUDRAFT_762317 [Laetiporus sulphureus 93-53]
MKQGHDSQTPVPTFSAAQWGNRALLLTAIYVLEYTLSMLHIQSYIRAQDSYTFPAPQTAQQPGVQGLTSARNESPSHVNFTESSSSVVPTWSRAIESSSSTWAWPEPETVFTTDMIPSATPSTLPFPTIPPTAATATPMPNYGSSGQCNTGSTKCCITVGDASDPSILGLVDDVLDGVTSLVDIGCSALGGILGECTAFAILEGQQTLRRYRNA